MDDATLARLEHENMHGWLALSFAQVPGATIRYERGVGVYATGLAIPLFNQVVTDDGATSDDVAAGVAILRSRGAPFCVVLRQDQDARHRPLMADLGLRAAEHLLPGMALEPIPTDLPSAPHGFDIRPVRDGAALHDHAIVASRGFDVPESIALGIIGERLWERDGAAVYVGYADGAAVTAGFSVRTGPTLGIFTIATVPEARGRGFGAAMTARLCADGAAAGCTVVALQASAMGRPIYERLGFRLVQPYEVHVG